MKAVCDLVEQENDQRLYPCPEWVEALLWDINREMERVHWNTFQAEMDSPFYNNGGRYQCGDTFMVCAYDWDDDSKANFYYKDIRIYWYKHLGRCTMINIEPHEEGFNEKMIEMYNTWVDAVCKTDVIDI